MQSYREEALELRLSLEAGLIHITEVIEWAEKALLACEIYDDDLANVCLAETASVYEMVSLLDRLGEGQQEWPAMRRTMARMYDALRRNRELAGNYTYFLEQFWIRHDYDVPDDMTFIAGIGEMFCLAEEGVCGNVKQATISLLDHLSHFKSVSQCDKVPITGSVKHSEMAIPKPRSEIVAAMILGTVLMFFVILALFNLFHFVAIISSGLWIVLVSVMVWVGCKEEGTGKFFIDLLGGFASKHFVECGMNDEGCGEIRFGYRFFGRRFVKLRVRLENIERVKWSTGQATDMAGRDMNDWCVSLWYDYDDRVKRDHPWRKHDQGLYCVGSCGRKTDTEALGRSLVDFLRKAGVTLAEGKDGCEFLCGVSDTVS